MQTLTYGNGVRCRSKTGRRLERRQTFSARSGRRKSHQPSIWFLARAGHFTNPPNANRMTRAGSFTLNAPCVCRMVLTRHVDRALPFAPLRAQRIHINNTPISASDRWGGATREFTGIQRLSANRDAAGPANPENVEATVTVTVIDRTLPIAGEFCLAQAQAPVIRSGEDQEKRG